MDASTLRALTDATPATRNRVVDFLRALAIIVVVVGHWLMAAIVVRDGDLVPNALLNIADWTHPLTWVFQVMPVFFLVGGYANAASLASPRRLSCHWAMKPSEPSPPTPSDITLSPRFSAAQAI